MTPFEKGSQNMVMLLDKPLSKVIITLLYPILKLSRIIWGGSLMSLRLFIVVNN
jgi:hypothetical protein